MTIEAPQPAAPVANADNTRLDASQVEVLREQLGRFYATLFDITDSGMLALRSANAPRLGFRERYVVPDVMITSLSGLRARGTKINAEFPQQADGGNGRLHGAAAFEEWYKPVQSARYGRTDVAFLASSGGSSDVGWMDRTGHSLTAGAQEVSAGSVVRTSADTWLASADRLVLVGSPGSGKSAFLRYALLDLLSDSPTLPRWAERFAGRLPVWLPFQFFTQQRAKHDGASASLASTLRAWLEQNDAGQLWDLVEKQLEDDRLLLIIDGLDEWVNESAARSAAASVETFLSDRQIPALVSTRPYGLTRVTLAGEWQYADLAVLSREQQRSLARSWFMAAHTSADSPTGEQLSVSSQGQLDALVERRVDTFMAGVGDSSELRQLAGTPLFLLSLVGLRLAGISLPTRRFGVYERVVDELLKDHPARRATATAVTTGPAALAEDDIRQVLAHVAFRHQSRGEFGPVAEGDVRADVIEAMKDPGHLSMSAGSAAAAARPFVEVAEGQLGVLVRYGHRELGFLHRVFLEQLAAEHVADRLPFAEQMSLFTDRAVDPRWNRVLLAALWRNRRAHEVSLLVQVLASQIREDRPESLTVRELLAEVAFGGYRLPASDVTCHAIAVLDTIDAHPYLPHRRRLLSACIAGLDDHVASRLLRDRLSRWTLAPLPLPPGLFRQLGRVASDSELESPVWPLLTAALTLEDLEAAYTAACSIANRYGGIDAAVRNALITAIRHAQDADHAALILLSLILGWPDESDVRELIAWGRRQEVCSVRVIALAGVLGVLERAVAAHDAAADPLSGILGLADDERSWLISQLHAEEDFRNSMWRPFIAHALLASIANHPAAGRQVVNDCLAILDKEGSRALGDRHLAWVVLLFGWPQDPAVLGLVCDLMRTDRHYVNYLGIQMLPLVYPADPVVAQAVEDALAASSGGHMGSELHALAVVDHGPAIRAELLKDLGPGSFPHWAAGALANHWPDDDDVQAVLRTILAGEPGQASSIANAAVRVLGPKAAVERLLALLASSPEGGTRIRRDIVVYALLEACQHHQGTTGAVAERIATACLNQLDDSADKFEADAEAAVIATLPATNAARDRVQAMLARPQAPMAALIAGYGQDPTAFEPIHQQLRAEHPPLPAALRLHLCTILRDSPASGSLVRQLTSRWPYEPDHRVSTAAAAAYHTWLLQDHRDGILPAGEWENAQTVLCQQAVSGGYLDSGHRQAAWLGLLLTDQYRLLDHVREPYGGRRPARLYLGAQAQEADLLLLSEIADKWPSLRAHFGAQLLDRLTAERSSRGGSAAWECLAVVAGRQPLLAQELAEAITEEPSLLDYDGVLAWYASAHQGENDLLNTLINRAERDGTNARSLPSVLLAEPHALGLDRESVRTRLHDSIDSQKRWYPPNPSGPLEALADGFPGDDIVQENWNSVLQLRAQGQPAGMHPRTYFPLTYAAVSAEKISAQLQQDIEMMAPWDTYFDPQFARAIVRRLRRDPSARTQIEISIMDDSTPDTSAAQLSSFFAAAYPMSQEAAKSLAIRIRRQISLHAPDMIHDYVSGTNLPVPLLLLRVLEPSDALLYRYPLSRPSGMGP